MLEAVLETGPVAMSLFLSLFNFRCGLFKDRLKPHLGEAHLPPNS
jgi:hypothetical protein